MKVTYYTEVISSWCYWAEPAWSALKAKYEGRVTFDWKLALMDHTGLPVSLDQLEWFYRRSGTIRKSPFILNSGWYDPPSRSIWPRTLFPWQQRFWARNAIWLGWPWPMPLSVREFALVIGN